MLPLVFYPVSFGGFDNLPRRPNLYLSFCRFFVSMLDYSFRWFIVDDLRLRSGVGKSVSGAMIHRWATSVD